MDRIIYTMANGSNRVLDAQAVIANNIANVSTPGFREQLAAYRSVPVTNGPAGNAGASTRVLTLAVSAPNVMDKGPIYSTGRALDAAIDGDGWFVVEDLSGNEGYTRAGNFTRNADGFLADQQGRLVLSSENNPIPLGDADRISFSRDGGINVVPEGGTAQDVQRIGLLKLVNPEPAGLVRGEDGLFRIFNAEGEPEPQVQDPQVRIQAGSLEGSNVSPAEAMVKMIENARRYDMQAQVIVDASENEQKANSILSVAG